MDEKNGSTGLAGFGAPAGAAGLGTPAGLARAAGVGTPMPLPSAAGILDMALWNPRFALGIILGVPRVPLAMNLTATFNSPATDAVPIVGALDTTIVQETWIEDVEYSIVQPNSFQGNVLKTQSDYYYKFTSGILVQLEVASGPRYVTSLEPTPIENIAPLLKRTWPSGWPLFCEQTIGGTFQLSQPPPSVPVTVTMTFLAWQFLDRCVDKWSDEWARCKLRELGIFSPSLDVLREC